MRCTMDRRIYKAPEIEVKHFTDDGVITASAPETTKDPNKPIELPFVPAE